MSPKKVCIVGSGNFGSAISRMVGLNAARLPHKFVEQVNMWVYEEDINGENLSDIINISHENVKYLPGRLLPQNIMAEPDLVLAARDADLLIFVLPHQFLTRVCQSLRGNLKQGARAISLIKGFSILPEGGIKLVSSLISQQLDIPVAVLIGANIANEVADEKFCETTIGANNADIGREFALLFQTENFRVSIVPDADCVEVCGALKNIVACGAGFCDGLKLGDNTKATVIRLGLKEIIFFVEKFYPGGDLSTFLESCGVADLVTTCYGGRNRRVAQAFVESNQTIAELEMELLNGQKLQGPETAAEVYAMLKGKNMEEEFPIFTQVHRICVKEADPRSLIEAMRNHPARL